MCRRDEVAGCSEEAYTSLKLQHARELLMFDSDELTLDYTAQVRLPHAASMHLSFACASWGLSHCSSLKLILFSCTMQRGWEQRDDRIYFQPNADKPARDFKSVEVIGNSLTYARELERIV